MTEHAHYRVGRHQAQNVYRHDPGGDPDGLYIGVFFNPETAALIVEALNGRDEAIRQRDFARELLDAYEREPASKLLSEHILANQKLAKELDDVRAKLALAEDHIADLEFALNGDKPK